MFARANIGGGGERDRTDDLLLAKQALSQLSYTPVQGPGISNQGSELQRAMPQMRLRRPVPSVPITDA